MSRVAPGRPALGPATTPKADTRASDGRDGHRSLLLGTLIAAAFLPTLVAVLFGVASLNQVQQPKPSPLTGPAGPGVFVDSTGADAGTPTANAASPTWTETAPVDPGPTQRDRHLVTDLRLRPHLAATGDAASAANRNRPNPSGSNGPDEAVPVGPLDPVDPVVETPDPGSTDTPDDGSETDPVLDPDPTGDGSSDPDDSGDQTPDGDETPDAGGGTGEGSGSPDGTGQESGQGGSSTAGAVNAP